MRIAPAEIANGIAQPSALFPRPVGALWLEIGYGGGEHLASQAAAHPDVGFLGCEPFIEGIGRLLSIVDEKKLDAVRLFDDDAALLIGALPDASIDRVFLLFPDPWPKARHEKRRFLSDANLDALARVTKSGAELTIATDHPIYLRYALIRMSARDDFEWRAERPADWREPPEDWVVTRYQAKAEREGRKATFLRYRRSDHTE